ncbi:hypothetical protein PTKU64_23460 [Paraburkholderia terrae]|uniref:DUF1302 domain-containing protein n=1 Tax=Paraburkholderia terrae TaxID=311230 RepID=A0ABM7TJQ7_9BURK|nr:hypothetical protein PTKU64_23460 [Paraburkholderia terrae]
MALPRQSRARAVSRAMGRDGDRSDEHDLLGSARPEEDIHHRSALGGRHDRRRVGRGPLSVRYNYLFAKQYNFSGTVGYVPAGWRGADVMTLNYAF